MHEIYLNTSRGSANEPRPYRIYFKDIAILVPDMTLDILLDTVSLLCRNTGMRTEQLTIFNDKERETIEFCLYLFASASYKVSYNKGTFLVSTPHFRASLPDPPF